MSCHTDFNAEKAGLKGLKPKQIEPSDYCGILTRSRKATENLFNESVRQGVINKTKNGGRLKRSWVYRFANRR